MRALFEPEHTTAQGDPEKSQSQSRMDATSSDGPFLDFLYPEKTQAMIKRLSIYGLRRWHRHMRNLTNHTSLRYFMTTPDRRKTTSSSTKKTRNDQSTKTTSGDEEVLVQNVRSPQEALQDLDVILRAHERGEYQESWKEAWELYSITDTTSKTPQLSRRLMSLLGSSPRSLDVRRAVRLFDSLAPPERTAASYTKAILGLLKLKETGRAVMRHAEAMGLAGLDIPIEGTKVLVAHLITERQWQLVFHVYENCAEYFKDNDVGLQEWTKELFESLVQMPGLAAKILCYLRAVGEYPHLLSDQSNSISFIQGLLNSMFDHGISFGVRRNWQVIEILKQLNLCGRETYEKMGLLVLSSVNAPLKSRKENALRIYKLYSQEENFSPSERFLHTLLKAAVDSGDQELVVELLSDWYQHYGLPSATLTGLVMKGFANAGDVEGVAELMSKLVSGRKDVTWKALYPVLHVHALHADPRTVQAKMAQFKDEFILEPDITCYNILLHAFQRVEDLDGTLTSLSQLLAAGLEPDHYTLGTIMSVAADRGDVELCEQMLQMAGERNIRRSTVMNDCLVLAYLNNSQVLKAENTARTLTIHSRQYVSTRMWNQILAHYSIDDRPANLRNTLRVARLMQKFKIPYDSMSYAAIMRAYTVKRRTDMARRILETVIIKKGLPVLPLHYAIVMDGYANQLNTEKGLRMQAEMLSRGIKPTISTKLALQKLHATAADRKSLIDRSRHPGLRLDVLDETLEESLATHDPKSIADRSPQLQSSRFRPADVFPASYFDLSLSFYSRTRSFDVVKTLIDKYTKLHGTSANTDMPLRFLATLMNLHYRSNDHTTVDRLFTLATNLATSAAKPISSYRGSTTLPPIRRHLLARHLDTLLRSLDARGTPSNPAGPRMLTAINTLFSTGFDLDSHNWNLYVQLLATRHDYALAFRLTELHLTPTLPPWSPDEPRVRYFQATGQKSEGTEFLGPRYTYLRPGELRASYKTLVRLAWVVRRLRRLAPFERRSQEVLEGLEREAPRTVKAVLEMPVLEHPVATHVLGARAGRGGRRRLPV